GFLLAGTAPGAHNTGASRHGPGVGSGPVRRPGTQVPAADAGPAHRARRHARGPPRVGPWGPAITSSRVSEGGSIMVSREFRSGLGLLALRVGLAGILMSHGAVIILATEWTGANWYGGTELPAWLQPVIPWTEFVCGVLLLLGLFTRLAALVVCAV